MAVKQTKAVYEHFQRALAHANDRPRFGKKARARRTFASGQELPGVSPNGKKGANSTSAEISSWGHSGIPRYLQSLGGYGFCETWESAFPDEEVYSKVWKAIRDEAEQEASSEPLLSSFLYASILAHKTFEQCLAFVLANRLATPTMLPTQLFEIFLEVLKCSPTLLKAAVADVEAVRKRDPACTSYSCALLYYKGYQALQVHRIANFLWGRGQKVMALTLQSSVSEAFSVDIHPGATIAPGVLIDHGTGVVIGETAIIGENCSILQNVTLGGTGKEVGDRHPKIGANVLVGASATILGNIHVGDGSQVAAGSLVLKPVPPHTMVAGSPAKVIGKVLGNPASRMEHWSRAPSVEDMWQQTIDTSSNIKAENAEEMAAKTVPADQHQKLELHQINIPDMPESTREPDQIFIDKQGEEDYNSAETIVSTVGTSHHQSDPEYFIYSVVPCDG